MTLDQVDKPIIGAFWMALSGICFVGVYVGVKMLEPDFQLLKAPSCVIFWVWYFCFPFCGCCGVRVYLEKL